VESRTRTKRPRRPGPGRERGNGLRRCGRDRPLALRRRRPHVEGTGLQGRHIHSISAAQDRIYVGTKPARGWVTRSRGAHWDALAPFPRWRSWFWWSPPEKPIPPTSKRSPCRPSTRRSCSWGSRRAYSFVPPTAAEPPGPLRAGRCPRKWRDPRLERLMGLVGHPCARARSHSDGAHPQLIFESQPALPPLDGR
jgi:hypothetical protein